MAIPFDILDHIFSFLITHQASLAACSEAHPVFSRMVEKYQYHQLTIDPESTSGLLTKLLSDKPRIANYVRVLLIEGEPGHPLISTTEAFFERIAVLLPLFPLMESIVLSYGDMITWEKDLPLVFQKALEACLHFPTLRELHINHYCKDFPISMLDNHPNIDCFSLRGTPKVSDVADTIYPQLESLSISGFYDKQHHISFGAWAKPRIGRLQSLQYDLSSDNTLLELLEICSDTLTSLDVTLDSDVDSQYGTTNYFRSPGIRHHCVPLYIKLPPHLQNLTIRARIRFYLDDGPYLSFPPVAIEILKAAPSMDCITLEINVDLIDGRSFDNVDLLPLTALADAPRSFRRIDLHFNFDWDFMRTRLVPLLANVGGIAELMEQGVLVVHLNGTKIHTV